MTGMWISDFVSRSQLPMTQKPSKTAIRLKPSLNGHAKTKSRRVAEGDTAPRLTDYSIERHVVEEAVNAAQTAQLEAVRDIIAQSPPHDIPALAKTLSAILEGASPEEAAVLRSALQSDSQSGVAQTDHDRDMELSDGWRTGAYPYKNLMARKSYEQQKYKLQVELLKLQAWVKATGQKVVILFEGRDAAGKGGTIKRFMEHLNPRGARVVALEKPSEVERGSGTSSGTSTTSPQRGRSCCSTGRGTTARGSSGSWGSANRTSTPSSCGSAPSSNAIWSAAERT